MPRSFPHVQERRSVWEWGYKLGSSNCTWVRKVLTYLGMLLIWQKLAALFLEEESTTYLSADSCNLSFIHHRFRDNVSERATCKILHHNLQTKKMYKKMENCKELPNSDPPSPPFLFPILRLWSHTHKGIHIQTHTYMRMMKHNWIPTIVSRNWNAAIIVPHHPRQNEEELKNEASLYHPFVAWWTNYRITFSPPLLPSVTHP